MLQASTLKFLKDLKKNNNKPWFEKNRSVYLDAKEDWDHFVEQVIEGFGKTDSTIATLHPKDCTYRIYRDVRFSQDKTPYKTHMGAYLNKGGKKVPTAGYYLHVEPGRNMAGGGLWMPQAPELNKVRQEIDYNLSEWTRMLGDRGFKKNFAEGLGKEDMLSRPPKGYDDENPAIEYLKLKSFIVTRTFTDAEVQSKTFLKEILKTFTSMTSFIQFLNRSLE
ncbi:DUF2461 domain-containing protein [Puia sp.]|jgi:uncharacterized protein (TIGR02453 family)|uniref:DUF2461 domain-containing protein n=1 Tax=Puia sp. TaxID=2045100 RepID=UPI002F3EE9F4